MAIGLALSRSWGAAGGAGPERTVFQYGRGEHRAASGVTRPRSPASPGGSGSGPGVREWL